MKEHEDLVRRMHGEQEETLEKTAPVGMALQLFADGEDIEWTRIKEGGKPIFTSPEADEAEDASDVEEEEIDGEETEVEEEAIYFPRLQVTDQNMPHNEVGEVLVNDEEGNMYSVSVDKNGAVTESLKLIENENIADGTITGEKLAEGAITSRELNVGELFGDSALINQMLTANLDVGELFRNEEYTEALTEHIRAVGRIELEDGTDLNTVLIPGLYGCPTNIKSTTITNKPVETDAWTDGFALDVLCMRDNGSEDYSIMQIIRSQTETWTRWIRIRTPFEVTAWERVMTDGYLNVSKATAGTLPIGRGGIGAGNRKDGIFNLINLGSQPITTPSGDTTQAWAALGNGIASYGVAGCLLEQPGQYGTLLNLHVSGNEINQIWLSRSSGALYFRSGNSNGWNGNGSTTGVWKRLWDSVSVVPASVGGTGRTDGKVAELATARNFRTNLASTSTASFNGSADCNPGVTGTLGASNGGTGRTDGKVAELANSRNFRTNLASTSTAGFTGAADCNPGVTGTLPVANGGTGRTDGRAVALATARTIGLSGGATGTATSFDGSANITIPVTALDVSKATAGTLSPGRGGTGQTSLASLRNALGFRFGVVSATFTGSSVTEVPITFSPAFPNATGISVQATLENFTPTPAASAAYGIFVRGNSITANGAILLVTRDATGSVTRNIHWSAFGPPST